MATADAALWVFGAGVLSARLERRVSWTPGAEGAPREAVVLVVWAVVGTMRRDLAVLLVACCESGNGQGHTMMAVV